MDCKHQMDCLKSLQHSIGCDFRPPSAIFRRGQRIVAQRPNGSVENLRGRSGARRTCRRVVMLCEKRVEMDWRTVDRELRWIAKRRAALDAEEARWIREAEALQIWRPLGMVSMLDYLERVLGYGPRKAQDRLRVARALGSLAQLTAALESGELAFSAVRELTRVVTPATEGAWREWAAGKNLREIEEKVAHRKPGDRPDDPPKPEPRMHVVRFELSPETFAMLRQARTALNEEHARNLDEDEFVKAMCEAVLDGAPATEPTGRAKF